MKEHPHSIWTLRGIPGGDVGVPSPADLEAWGKPWHAASDDYLIGVAARAIGGSTETVTMPASIVAQCRLRAAIREFDEGMRVGSERLVATENRLSEQTATLIALANETSRQTDKMLRLTAWIIGLTVILGVIAALQLWLMVVKGA